MSISIEPSTFAALANEPFISITTFRRDGSPAATPVWVVSDHPGRLLVATGAGTWKVRRIRRDPHVRVAACMARGKVRGEAFEATARLVNEGPLVRRLQAEKYGWRKWLIEKAYGLTRVLTRKPAEKAVFLEIVPRVVEREALSRAA